MSNDATVTIVVTGPPGPPIVGNDLYEVQQGRELVVAAPGRARRTTTSPNPRLALTVLLQTRRGQGHAAAAARRLVRLHAAARLHRHRPVQLRRARLRGPRVRRRPTSASPSRPADRPTATVGATSPADGARRSLGPTHVHRDARRRRPARRSPAWTVSYRRPGERDARPARARHRHGGRRRLRPDAGPQRDVRDRHPRRDLRRRRPRRRDRRRASRATTSRAATRRRIRDVALNSANIPIELLRTYDSTNKAAGDFGAGWSLELANFRIDTNGPLGGGGWSTFTCGSVPVPRHLLRAVEAALRHRHLARRARRAVPLRAQPGLVSWCRRSRPPASSPSPARRRRSQPVDNGLLLSGGDFLLGDFFSADGIYDPIQFVLTDKSGIAVPPRPARRAARRSPTATATPSASAATASTRRPGSSMTLRPRRRRPDHADRRARREHRLQLLRRRRPRRCRYPNGTTQTFTYDAEHNLLTTSGGGQLVRTVHYDDAGRVTVDHRRQRQHVDDRQRRRRPPAGRHRRDRPADDGHHLRRPRQPDPARTADRCDGQDASPPGRRTTTSAASSPTTDGLGHTTSQTYDAAGTSSPQTDANGKTTTFTYNALRSAAHRPPTRSATRRPTCTTASGNLIYDRRRRTARPRTTPTTPTATC